MTHAFDYFVVFAEMRTGSNFLEENLNRYPDIECYGEVFNPHFLAYPDKDELFGYTHADRESDPFQVLNAIKTKSNGIGGFRFFHDHDGRILEKCLDDPKCGKVILTRNPVDSFVSWKIASATGQWKLTNATHQKSEKIHFDIGEFEDHMAKLQSFQIELLNRLQMTGQTAFYVAYEDVQNIEVMNGLAKFLGSKTELDGLSKKLKKQNPSPMSDKVANFDDMVQGLARLDRFNLSRTPNFEPRRGANLPSYTLAQKAPLLFMPIKCGPTHVVKSWMADLDQVDMSNLRSNLSQKEVRQWKRQNKGHRSFTVVRHPVARAYDAFCRHIFHVGPGSYKDLRATLRKVHNLPVPEGTPGDNFTLADMRAAFLSFLKFVKANLSGQTAVRVDTAWASQAHFVQGLSEFASPDLILRETNLADELIMLSTLVGYSSADLREDPVNYRFTLEEVYNEEIEAAVRDVYQKDYLTFGFYPLHRS